MRSVSSEFASVTSGQREETTLKSTALIVGSLLAAASFGQKKQEIYEPNRHLPDQGVTVTSWGSGSVHEADEAPYEGVFSIRISTHNFFQGGILHFAKPIDLTSEYNTADLLRFAFLVADSDMVLSGKVSSNKPSGGGLGRGGGQGNTQKDVAGSETKVTLHVIRVIFGTTDGLKSEAYLDLDTSQTDRAWKLLAVPLKGINGFDKTNKIVQTIAISGDTAATFYLGDLRMINDTTPITGDMNVQHDLNLALGDEVQFVASGYAGASILKYTWDFDASDGIQEDATGQVVKRQFRKPGTFVVTLTIKDLYGLKKPFTKTVNVKVNP